MKIDINELPEPSEESFKGAESIIDCYCDSAWKERGLTDPNCPCQFRHEVAQLLDVIEKQDSQIQNLAMLVRRLMRKCPDSTLFNQANGYLLRNNLQGSILR